MQQLLEHLRYFALVGFQRSEDGLGDGLTRCPLSQQAFEGGQGGSVNGPPEHILEQPIEKREFRASGKTVEVVGTQDERFYLIAGGSILEEIQVECDVARRGR